MSLQNGPLTGLKVLELGGIGPGPFAGMMLADLGATIIRIDNLNPSSVVGRPFERDLVNRGKQSVLLDLKQDDGRKAALALLSTVDVLIEGFRPGVAEALGLGPETCSEINPRLIYGRMTGWGQTGPLKSVAGHDINYIGIAGALHGIGEVDGGPQIPMNLLGDYAGGSAYLVVGVLAALRERELTGRGQVVDAAIVDGVSHLLANNHSLLNTGFAVDRRGSNFLDGGAPFYSVYRTSDDKFMAVGAMESKFFKNLVEKLAIPFPAADQLKRDLWPELRDQLARAFSARTRREWTEFFDGTDACVSPVLSLREAAEHPHLTERKAVVFENDELQPSPAPRFSAHPQRPLPKPPKAGEHTRSVLEQIPGIDVDSLIKRRVAG